MMRPLKNSHCLLSGAYGLCVMLLVSCSTLPTSKPLAPEVEIATVDILAFGLTEQKLAFTLDVFNPNDYDLPVNLLEFMASSKNETVATGNTNEPVLLSAQNQTQVVVDVTMRTGKLLGQLLESALKKQTALDYNVTGFVELANWPVRIPFNVDKSFTLD